MFITPPVDVDALTTEEYIIFSDAYEWKPFTGDFEISTTPVDHELCGGVQFTPLRNSLALTGDVLTFGSNIFINRNDFSAYSEDCDLIGTTENYSLVVEVGLYPSSQGYSTGFS